LPLSAKGSFRPADEKYLVKMIPYERSLKAADD
jgi:hypothetical protein